MPPDTLWTGNPNLKLTVSQGNIACDDANTLCDALVYVDGVAPANLVNIYQPNNTLYTEGTV